LFSFSASGITLDKATGTLSTSGRMLIKGFNVGNPHHGDAIIATFYWLGSRFIIDSVTDVLTTSPSFTPVGNQYHLVDYVTAGGYSMATYVATNVQNFPDPFTDPGQVLAVRANLSDSVADGGITITAWTGVEDNFAAALGDRASKSGSDATVTLAHAGPIAIGAGSLAYTVTMSGLWGLDRPQGYNSTGGPGSDNVIKEDAAYAVQASAGTVDPAWAWFYGPPGDTWLVTTLALNPGKSPPGDLTVTTSTTGLSLDLDGYTVTVDGSQTRAVASNGSVTFTGLPAGSHSVTLSGVAVNCTVNGSNPRSVDVPSGATASTTYAVSCVPGPATALVFTVQPSNTGPSATITPAVRATVVDAQRNTVTNFTGPVTIVIGRNAGLLVPGTLSGTTTVTPVSGVATFSNLSIDQLGSGYTLRVSAAGLTGAESASFNIALVCSGPLCL